MRKTPLLGTLALGLLAAHATALAQSGPSYPVKPVLVVIPLAPGGGVDIATRVYAQKLGEQMGQQFIIDYKPGAGTTIGTGFVASAPPDGYTLLSASANFAVAPALYRKLSWDPVKDFAPITLMSKAVTLLLVNPSVPVGNLRDYLTLARTKPGALNFGTTGVGSATHLAGAWLHGATGVAVTYVPFKGAGEVLVALSAGHINVGFGSTTSSVPYVKSGKLRAIAVTNAERSSVLPDLPTIIEQGVAGYDYAQWLGLFAPAGTPAAIVARLNNEFAAVTKHADVIKRFADFGERPVTSSPEELRQLVIVETARWLKLMAESGAKLEN
ncbi:MAG: tripartite tricarboxylate transporter substrate binding protein [Betaproteobacteria bacterium]|nr:tripartite tricarboxylate transporter substrate binding protein [Betaproteobacteria bacterium]